MRLISAPLAGCLLAAMVFAARTHFSEWHQAAFLEEALLFMSGFLVGVRLPDFDLLLPGFSHRSAMTHSCLAAYIAQLLGYPAIAGGLALGIALHLSSDLQPKAWTGGALIKLPVMGSIGMLSPLWLIVNIVGCLAVLLTTMEMEPKADRLAVLAVILLGGGWYFHQEEKKRLLPLVTLAFSLLLVHTLRDGRLTVQIVLQYFA